MHISKSISIGGELYRCKTFEQDCVKILSVGKKKTKTYKINAKICIRTTN